MNTTEAFSVSKLLDENATKAVEVEAVTTSGYGRSSFLAPGEAIQEAKRKHLALSAPK
jgi:hypothetical protein